MDNHGMHDTHAHDPSDPSAKQHVALTTLNRFYCSIPWLS